MRTSIPRLDRPLIGFESTAASPVPADNHRLYAHFAWTTLARLPLVPPERRAPAESHLLVLCRALDIEPLEVCVLADRVHLLIRFAPGHSLADLARRLLGSSEALLDRAGHPVRWSRRFAVETVSPTQARRLMRRIARRAESSSVRAPGRLPATSPRPEPTG